MARRTEARKKLTTMYKGLLIAIRCTCLLNENGKSLVLTNINKILKDTMGEERATREDFRGCVDTEAHWKNLVEKWLK